MVYCLGFPYFAELSFGDIFRDTALNKVIFYLVAILHLSLFFFAVKCRKKWLVITAMVSIPLSIAAGWFTIELVEMIIEAMGKALFPQ